LASVIVADPHDWLNNFRGYADLIMRICLCVGRWMRSAIGKEAKDYNSYDDERAAFKEMKRIVGMPTLFIIVRFHCSGLR